MRQARPGGQACGEPGSVPRAMADPPDAAPLTARQKASIRQLSIAFFFLLLLAGVTSAVAQIEVLVATLEDSCGIGRTKGVVLVGGGLLLLNVPVVLSQGPWSEVSVFGMDLFVLTDYVSGSVLLPIGALALALYVAISWGWKVFRDDLNQGAGTVRVGPSWKPFVMVLIPLAVAMILLVGLRVI